ncbi:MAG TPA: membrane dipeptidase [Thermoanaerobaculales bacterium]|nr:membrane dipeptidase [Thermoanaerobaculales bacterium]
MHHCLLAEVAVALAVSRAAVAATPVVDGHNHDGLSVAEGRIETSKLEGLSARGIQVVMVPLPVDRTRTPGLDLEARIVREIDWLRRVPGRDFVFPVVGDPAQLLGGVPGGEIRVLFSIEWFGEILGSDVSRVRRFRDLGVRMIGLAEEDHDQLFGSGDRSSSLSHLGRAVIAAMNDVGVLIDITHLTHAQQLEVIRQSRAPVVASHSLVQAVTPVAFNLPDEVVAALAETGGSVWVSFQRSDLLGDMRDARAADVLVDHIDYLVKRMGVDRVGIGTDQQRGGQYVPEPLNRMDAFAEIGARLRKRGYSQQAIEGILGGNVLRALATAGGRGVRSASPNPGPSNS